MPDRKGRPGPRVLTAALCVTLALVGYIQASSEEPEPPPSPRPAAKNAGVAGRPPSVDLGALPGVGPLTRTKIPDGTGQALVVTGETRDTHTATAILYERDAGGRWRRAAGPWAAHNALRGWTADHTAGDLRTPTGVFRLGDAGGRLPDPGARLPYDQDKEFATSGTGFFGESLEGSFDYVVAIDYNRVPGRTPLDKERPLGPGKGGGVWLHVDHGGPTQACVSLPRDDMRELLLALDPVREPVVVMGPAADIAR
ncbi:L,D-transpeptidase family protein [Streptomyces sp. ISL-36]|uniref:L,D-transpeptidase family protein n=1 Tax=Streptomyces sp. ISL-36 TaxID=2819182 RepID=UPI002035C1A2|nr:L,D-transpeptidase family protein [Streptomyces sp. ISL-36]